MLDEMALSPKPSVKIEFYKIFLLTKIKIQIKIKKFILLIKKYIYIYKNSRKSRSKRFSQIKIRTKSFAYRTPLPSSRWWASKDRVFKKSRKIRLLNKSEKNRSPRSHPGNPRKSKSTLLLFIYLFI